MSPHPKHKTISTASPAGFYQQIKVRGLDAAVVLVSAATFGYLLELNPIISFLLAGFAVIPLASIIASSTESISDRSGYVIGGLLNATFGNATEMIVAIVALQSGQLDLVKASISGTLITNLLLAMGLAIFMGGIKYREQTFNRRVARINASSLNLALVVLFAPAAIQLSSSTSQEAVKSFSLVASLLLLGYYALTLLFSMKTHRGLFESGELKDGSQGSVHLAPEYDSAIPLKPVVTLIVTCVVLTFISEILLASLEKAIESLKLTPLFTGVILIPLFGGTVEYLAAIRFARGNKVDLALAIAMGSSLQIAMFVAPVLVIVGWLIHQPMDLDFNPFELLAIMVAVFITNSISQDGRSSWLEGILLLITYIVIATAFYFHP